MNSSNSSLSERVAGSIQKLSIVATDLNNASNELNQAISAIDTVLQSLNIGLPTWTKIQDGNGLPDDERYWQRDIGYAKIGNKWGIALRDVAGHYNFPDDEHCDSWLFNDAPRWLRIEGIAKIPDLLEDLIKNTEETTKKVKTKTSEVIELATIIAQAAGNPKAKTSGTSPAANPLPPAAVPRPVDPIPAGPPMLSNSGVTSGPKSSLPLSSVVRVAVQMPAAPGGKKFKGGK
jgi:hypothetical protein